MSDEDLISMRDPEYVGRGKRIHELKARIAELEAALESSRRENRNYISFVDGVINQLTALRKANNENA